METPKGQYTNKGNNCLTGYIGAAIIMASLTRGEAIERGKTT